MAILIFGTRLFGADSFKSFLGAVGFFVILALPFCLFLLERKLSGDTEQLYNTANDINSCVEELEALTSDIETYSPDEYDESPRAHLADIKDEIASIASRLKHLAEDID
ncbi:MAG: hypothetical protein KJ887_01450 [Candidatus Omnitrophica bacterium]|nr:hypothetical protein [Candidatus Omnitrophota bacterium]MBU1047324.1 hypothetical protein [Candidatus Omnitrophota bacterium]MBU1630651.1 hypothetical protein [Candidatus Omnitrophota bacterium]MBU1889091.1 hypothetical protein [Candidatus Omnitrophota bacterium]